MRVLQRRATRPNMTRAQGFAGPNSGANGAPTPSISHDLVLRLACALAMAGGCVQGEGNGGASPSGTGLDNGPWDPELCSPVAQSRGAFPGTCTQADFDKWNTCVVEACQGTFETCYGPEYRDGKFAGPCQPFIECAASCSCNDADCTLACPGAKACADCVQANVCGGDCTEPACALAGTGIDGTKTCADLKRCCLGLSDAADSAECASNADMLADIPGGEFTCAGFYGVYRSISSTCN